MFRYQPPIIQIVSDSNFRHRLHEPLGDVRQPWIDIALECNVTEFEAKALFTLGLMRRYVLSANEILRGLRHRGVPFAYAMLSSSIELLGRCIHPNDEYRQHSEKHSTHRLKSGLQFIRNSANLQDVILSTNHVSYTEKDLINLRNLAVHGACISSPGSIKADIELLHELRRLIFGTPIGEQDAIGQQGPIEGAGDRSKCDLLASSAISPLHFLQLHNGQWPFAQQLINDIKSEIERNLKADRPPISGGHRKQVDYFELT